MRSERRLKMQQHGVLWLTLLLVCDVSARDPFAPIVCAPKPPQWQLRGIVGREGDYRAWFLYPPRQWVQKKVHESLDVGWQLTSVDALSVTVHSSTMCQPPLTFMLKGQLYAQDDNAVAAGLAQPVARQK